MVNEEQYNRESCLTIFLTMKNRQDSNIDSRRDQRHGRRTVEKHGLSWNCDATIDSAWNLRERPPSDNLQLRVKTVILLQWEEKHAGITLQSRQMPRIANDSHSEEDIQE